MMNNRTGRESRVKRTLMNARVNLIFYFLILALSFFSRKIFLNTLGADFVGLTGTLQNLLGFLNLAELGVGTAIGYVLYKPLFEHDEERINEIISVMGYLYRNIGFVILGAGCLLACFLPLIFPAGDTGFSPDLIYFAYFAFLASSLIGYFINYRQNLLGADQRNYVVTVCMQSTNIVKMLVQMASAYYTGNYYLWVAIELGFGIAFSFILNWKINRTYPWLAAEIRQGKALIRKYPEVMRYVRQLFIQKISSVVQYQTVPFLVYAFVNLKIVAFYGNYTIITDKLSQFVNSFLESSGASIGNLIAEGDMPKIKRLFWELISIRYLIGGTIAFGIYMLVDPFISLWLGPDYLLPHGVLLLIVMNVFISYTRGGVMQFLYGFGLFYDIWAPVAEIVINLSVAIVGGYFWGLPGVVSGGLVSQILIVGIWKPCFLFTQGFKESVWVYWRRIFLHFAAILFPAVLITCVIGRIVCFDASASVMNWLSMAVAGMGGYVVLAVGSLYVLTSGMRDFLHRILAMKIKKL